MCSGNDDNGTIVTANVVKSSSLKKKPHDLVITIKDDIPAGVPAKGNLWFCKQDVAVC